ncbi:MAG: cobalt transporter subunit CbtA [Gammaproteobacteria bacterium]|jgi:cobalt transporter subunit CbtA
MFRSIVMSACLAGLGAGVVLTAVQQPTVAPIILAAEIYETAAVPTLAHQHGDSHEHGAVHQPAHAEASLSTTHADDSAATWAPEDGLQRTFWSLLTNISAAIGFALLLCAVYTLLPNITAARGALWGLAGFVVFFANPGIGLHPEIPGAPSADLFDRQLWWTFAAICSAAAAAAIAWRRTLSTWGAAVALLVLPHLLGAPQPQVGADLAPQALAEQFIWASIFVNAVFWLTLGVSSALIFRSLSSPPRAS